MMSMAQPSGIRPCRSSRMHSNLMPRAGSSWPASVPTSSWRSRRLPWLATCPQRLGLPDEMHESLRIAALLHDVGKIGIPDDILRKPGRLTPYEYEIVKQHVALGDLLVRGVPNVEQIRDGVRYHHERWDGQGYMVDLAGENIPVIARILSVADSFSAMTTNRPYRKALPA